MDFISFWVASSNVAMRALWLPAGLDEELDVVLVGIGRHYCRPGVELSVDEEHAGVGNQKES